MTAPHIHEHTHHRIGYGDVAHNHAHEHERAEFNLMHHHSPEQHNEFSDEEQAAWPRPWEHDS